METIQALDHVGVHVESGSDRAVLGLVTGAPVKCLATFFLLQKHLDIEGVEENLGLLPLNPLCLDRELQLVVVVVLLGHDDCQQENLFLEN